MSSSSQNNSGPPKNLPPPLQAFVDVYGLSTDVYAVLGLSATNNPDDKAIEKAYKKLSLVYHPDKQKFKKKETQDSEEDVNFRFVQIKAARDVLLDAASRRQLDEKVAAKRRLAE